MGEAASRTDNPNKGYTMVISPERAVVGAHLR